MTASNRFQLIRSALAAVAATLLLLAAPPILAAETAAPAEKPALAKPASLDAAAASVVATVDAIDYKKRELTLRADNGETQQIVVGPEVTRFDAISKGDQVEVDYFGAIAVAVQPADKNIASVEGGQSVIVRNQGKKPSGMRVDTEILTATVDAIDAKKRTASLIGPEGRTLQIDIAPDVPAIENIRKGDRIVVRVTRTVAIAVRKPADAATK